MTELKQKSRSLFAYSAALLGGDESIFPHALECIYPDDNETRESMADSLTDRLRHRLEAQRKGGE